MIKTKLVTSQQEFAKSKFKSYIDTGINAVKATGIDDRIITTFNGKPPKILP